MTAVSGPESIPFWRKPLPNLHIHQGGSSENEGSSVGSRVNIYQKLQEKKQKQLAELKIIEEEIRQGKLGGPNNKSQDNYSTLPRQPIPISKKHNDIQPIGWASLSPELEKSFEELKSIANNSCLNYQDHNISNYDMLNSTILYRSNMYAHDLNEFKRPCQNNGNASPVSQISATESNSLTQKTLSHIHMAQEFSYPENIQVYNNANENNMHLSNFNDSLFLKDSSNEVGNTSMNNQTQSTIESESVRVYDRRTGLSSDGTNQVSEVLKNKTSINTYDNLHLKNIQDSLQYNVILPPKTKLERIKLDQRRAQRSQTPEILLSPNYLNNVNSYVNQRDPTYRY